MQQVTLTEGKPVLFISHDAKRTGAPLLLLNFLEWVRENTHLKFDVLLGEGGELESKFMAIAPTRVFKSFSQSMRQEHSILLRLARRLGHQNQNTDKQKILQLATVARAMGRENYGLVYANTIAAGKVIRQLDTTGCPVISHIHELDFWLGCREPSQNVSAILNRSEHFIVVSNAVGSALRNLFDINETNMTVINGFVPTKHYSMDAIGQTPTRAAMLRDLGIPENAFIVGASGTLDWRKGPDLFLQMALEFKIYNLSRPIHFLWIGGDDSSIAWKQLKHDCNKAGIAHFTHFVGAKCNPMAYYSLFDIFALVSREDPFPLVMLEAASLGKPILCFDKGGGAKEFVQGDAGVIVPYLDISRMADCIRMFCMNRDELDKMGICGKDRANTNHIVDRIAPQILNTMERFSR